MQASSSWHQRSPTRRAAAPAPAPPPPLTPRVLAAGAGAQRGTGWWFCRANRAPCKSARCRSAPRPRSPHSPFPPPPDPALTCKPWWRALRRGRGGFPAVLWSARTLAPSSERLCLTRTRGLWASEAGASAIGEGAATPPAQDADAESGVPGMWARMGGGGTQHTRAWAWALCTRPGAHIGWEGTQLTSRLQHAMGHMKGGGGASCTSEGGRGGGVHCSAGAVRALGMRSCTGVLQRGGVASMQARWQMHGMGRGG